MEGVGIVVGGRGGVDLSPSNDSCCYVHASERGDGRQLVTLFLIEGGWTEKER